MTGEEKLAEEYFKKTYPSYIGCDKFTEDIKDAVIYGLNARKPEWHKVADGDLPNNDRIVSAQDGNNVRYVKHRNKWFYRDRTCEADVIAWCEIPKYTEE